MRTALDTPEIDSGEVYGVIWDADEAEPLVEYADLEEAKQIASAMNGYLMFRRVSRGEWEVLPAERL